jgi:hypothetical protein
MHPRRCTSQKKFVVQTEKAYTPSLTLRMLARDSRHDFGGFRCVPRSLCMEKTRLKRWQRVVTESKKTELQLVSERLVHNIPHGDKFKLTASTGYVAMRLSITCLVKWKMLACQTRTTCMGIHTEPS